MKNLSDARREVAVLPEVLGQRNKIGKLEPDRFLIVKNPSLVRTPTGQEGGSARVAHRILRIGMLESLRPPRKLVQIRRQGRSAVRPDGRA